MSITNEIEQLTVDVYQLTIVNRKEEKKISYFSVEDLDLVRSNIWTFDPSKDYINRGFIGKEKYVKVLLHREILKRKLEKKEILFTDHINHNRLDNTRGNLRECTQAENNRNSVQGINKPKYGKGVTFNIRLQKYISQISVNKKKIHLGCFDTPELAALAYMRASELYHKEFGNY